MANPEQLELLKEGIKQWNEWREKHPDELPILVSADLHEANLSRANLVGAILHGANLRGADLNKTDLFRATLFKANLSGANLSGANLSMAGLSEADLSGAHLIGADLRSANLYAADFTGAWAGYTNFAGLDLSVAKGLETIQHEAPSTVGIDTIYNSGGKIPEVFLRGCGVPKNFIEYMRSLVVSPIDFYSCFISYSSKDQEFAKCIYSDLRQENVRCWYAPEDLKIGDKFQKRIEDSIRLHHKVLLVLSENSVNSNWVEREVQAAREMEDTTAQPVLFLIRTDAAVMNTTKAWAADLRRVRHIGDFTSWRHHDPYQKALERLLSDLKADSLTYSASAGT